MSDPPRSGPPGQLDPVEAEIYPRAVRRIYRTLFVLAAAGTLACLWWQRLPGALGFLLGSGFAILSFRGIHKFADSLGRERNPSRRRVLAGKIARYLVLALCAYVILQYFTVNRIAAVAGALILVAAVLIEIAYELIYARA